MVSLEVFRLQMESPEALIIPVTLQGPNYYVWSRMMKIALVEKGLWRHCSSDDVALIVEGEASSELARGEAWKREDLLVLFTIELNMAQSILEAHAYCESAKELWSTLKLIYGNQCDLYEVFKLKKTINELSQEENEFITHLGRFKSLKAELEELRPQTFELEMLKERREQYMVIDLLLTLKPAYNNLIMCILRSEELPSLEEVCAHIQKEECSMGFMKTKGTFSFVSHAEGSSQRGKAVQKDERDKRCDHCKKVGHLKKECWELYPTLKPVKLKCDHCKKVGHVEKECWELYPTLKPVKLK